MNFHHIKRGEVILTNAVLCRPQDNANPPKAAIAACQPRLLHELASVREAVALGNFAAQALLGNVGGITKLRIGPPRPSPYRSDLSVVPTIHPAACLRSGDNFPSLVTDIGKLGLQANTWTEPEVIVAYEEAEALQLIAEIHRGLVDLPEEDRALAVDIECNIDKDVSFDHPNKYEMLCVGLATTDDWGYVLAKETLTPAVYRALGELLRIAYVIAHNGKFDLAGLYPHTGPIDLDFDTMLAHYCLDERRGIHRLKGLAQEYRGAPPYDDAIQQYVSNGAGYGNIPKNLLYTYNGYDVTETFGLFGVFKDLLAKDPGLQRVHELLILGSRALMYTELNGITIDGGYIDKLTHEYLGRLEMIVEGMRGLLNERGIEVRNSAGKLIDFNPASPKQVKEVLKKLGVRVDSTNEETINNILDLGFSKFQESWYDNPINEFCTNLLKHRREAKLYGTYIKGIRQRRYRGRVYPTFMLHGTTTGRLSCRNPNLQNVPRESSIRRLFVPSRPGYVFVQTDYSQAELRVLSYLAGDKYFRSIFNDGTIDVFDDLTPRLYPSLGAKHLVDPAQWKEVRIRVKAFVYGLGYGRGHVDIAREFKMPINEAAMLKRNFFQTIPEIVQWQRQIQRDVQDGKDLITPWGRRRRFHLITKENLSNTLNEALAFKPQSTSSDICLQAFAWARERLKGKAWLRNIVHDSILAECREEYAEEVARILDECMIESAYSIVGDYVKFATDSKIGNHWGAV